MLFHNDFDSYLMNRELHPKESGNKEWESIVIEERELAIAFPKEKKYKVLLIEPHPDDVVLSMGASLLQLIEDAMNVLCLCIFSRGGQEESIRKQESYYIWKEQLGSRILFGELTDYAYRKAESTSELVTFRQCTELLEKVISVEEPDFLIGPMGMGEHIDHSLVNQALFEIGKKEKKKILFYEDFPYSTRDKYYYMKAVNKGKKKWNLNPLYNPVKKYVENKTKLCMAYQSQIQSTWDEMLEVFVHYGKAIGYEGSYVNRPLNSYELYERFWFKLEEETDSRILFPNGIQGKER